MLFEDEEAIDPTNERVFDPIINNFKVLKLAIKSKVLLYDWF
jgi:hypothetical protein